jgi:hypothetical protein
MELHHHNTITLELSPITNPSQHIRPLLAIEYSRAMPLSSMAGALVVSGGETPAVLGKEVAGSRSIPEKYRVIPCFTAHKQMSEKNRA